jgi:DNA mismatch repair protein MutS
VSDCILFFRLGDFYEMFVEDAKLVSRDWTLRYTRDGARNRGRKGPMCGSRSFDEAYIARSSRALQGGRLRAARGSGAGQGGRQRDIIASSPRHRDRRLHARGRQEQLHLRLTRRRARGLCFADISTGQVYARTSPGRTVQRILNELGRFVPSEAVLSGRALLDD